MRTTFLFLASFAAICGFAFLSWPASGRVLDDLPSGIDSTSERNRTATINSGNRTTRLT